MLVGLEGSTILLFIRKRDHFVGGLIIKSWWRVNTLWALILLSFLSKVEDHLAVVVQANIIRVLLSHLWGRNLRSTGTRNRATYQQSARTTGLLLEVMLMAPGGSGGTGPSTRDSGILV